MKIVPLCVSPSKSASISFNKQKAKIQNQSSGHIIAFRGGANKNQIAVITPECAPFTHTGGVSTVVAQRTASLKKEYPDKDIRVFLPFYNPTDKQNYSSTGFFDKNTRLPLKYKTEPTGITAEVEYGVRKTRAELYKIKNSGNDFPIYLVYAPEFDSGFTKEYDHTGENPFWVNYNIFCKALAQFMDKMKDTKEKFHPGLLHAVDPTSSFILQNSKKPSLYEITDAHRSSDNYIPPFAAMLNIFSKEQIEKIKKDKDFQKHFSQFAANNNDVLNAGNDQKKILSRIKTDDKFYQGLLVSTAENYQDLSTKFKNKVLINEINANIRKHTNNDYYYDSDIDYSSLITALKQCDNWIVPSDDYFRKVLTSQNYCSGQFNSMAVLRMQNGIGVLNGINPKDYNPSDPNQVVHTYNVRTVKKGKRKNKEFIFNHFSKENLEAKNYHPKAINSLNSPIYGYLDKENIDKPLVVNISRYDEELKGQDIAIKTIEKILNETNANVIAAMASFSRFNPEKMKWFINKVVNKPENRGRIVFIDNFVPVHQYFAGADFSMITSRSESCGLIGFQSMRMGAIPIATPVGAMPETIIQKGVDEEKANGYLAPPYSSQNISDVEKFSNTLISAIDDYNNNPSLIETMTNNSMLFDSSWENSNKKLVEIYDKTIQGKKLNGLTRKDLLPPEKKHDLSILTKKDIDKLPEADVLVFLAHDDDEIFFLPAFKYLQEGKRVQIIYGAKGDKGHFRKNAPTSPEELSKHRDNELCNALNALGIKRDPLKLNYPDDDLHMYRDKIEEDFEQIINRVKPKVVFTFGPYGFTGHPDHKVIGKAALKIRNDYNRRKDKDVEIYQPVLTRSAAKYFRDTAIANDSDSFDFVIEGSVPNNDKSVQRVDMSSFAKQIEESTKAHVSQWSEKEVETFVDFYTKNPVELQSLDKTTDDIDYITNPWSKRDAQLSATYGKDFIAIFDGVKMVNIEKGLELDLYLSKIYGIQDKTRLWVSSQLFNDKELRKPVLDFVAESIKKIKAIKKFNNVEMLEFRFKDEATKKKTIYCIPFDELDYFRENSDTAFADCNKFIQETKKLNPNSKIELR